MGALLGIDVGTASARAGVFSADGTLLGHASQPIALWRPAAGFVQQSSEDIWQAVAIAVRAAMNGAGHPAIDGIGFDATCSLVALDAEGGPVSVDPAGAAAQNVIVWMDHRAEVEAAAINAGGHDVLAYVGGRISLEMQTPKLLWLKRHLPERFARIAHFFDLPDFLTYKATGSRTRSLCSTVCKWTYLGHEGRWDAAYFNAIGLGELTKDGFARIGGTVAPLGEKLGGLSAEAAATLGLPPGIPVGVSAIDAHAGGLGVIGAALDGATDFDRRLALIGGTSSCHMAVSRAPRFVPGIWGPYFSAMLPGFWLNEGGQSATGALLDHIVQSHPAYPALAALAAGEHRHVFAVLAERLTALAGPGMAHAPLARDLHVMPDFHGNRSPRADASLRGMVSGLTLSAGPDDLALLYLATIQAIACGTRHIAAALNAQGYAIDTILACGGGTRDPVYLQAHADATGCRIVLAREDEAVLLGSAILGAVASGVFPCIEAAMAGMSRAGRIIAPDPAMRNFYDAKYAVFQRMHDDQLAYRARMAGV
ncbi:MAG: FGGY-family carbohydrate kinase [Rhodospirillales bacterium]|nr:FGGY-family carbohydrate kinase [Rhodospirillales bacterium]